MFDPVFPRPCYGIVPRGVPIRVVERPWGHVVGVNEDNVFSRAMAGFLEGFAPLERGAVVVKGASSSNWFRLFPEERCEVIAPEGLREYRCAFCDTPGVTKPGIWLGRRVAGLSVCGDACGVRHLGTIHPLVLSLEIAEALVKRFPRETEDYNMQPVVDVESADGRRVLELLGRLQRLKAPE